MKSAYSWGDYIKEDSMVIIAVPQGGGLNATVDAILEDALGVIEFDNACVSTTTTTSTAAPSTTTSTSTLTP
jgi:hypothetical protein